MTPASRSADGDDKPDGGGQPGRSRQPDRDKQSDRGGQPDGGGQPDRSGQPDRDGDRRDRDAAGRARNARPRDGLGRPLPRSADAGEAGVPEDRVPEDRVPDDLRIGPAEAAALGRSLLEQGRPFHAHEVFEAAWKTGPPAERELWQGLAQIAVGVTHARRGNPRGAVSLLRRGARRVSDYAAHAVSAGAAMSTGSGDAPDGPGAAPDSRPYGIDPAATAARAEDIAAVIDRDGLPAVPEATLRSPLMPQ
jgi:hypothetical protein